MFDRNKSEKHFEFGRNWRRYSALVNESRIQEAADSLKQMLGESDLSDKTFLDAGSGSGLFSLAAFRLGASKIHSFDFDPDSVGTTEYLRQTHAPNAPQWTIERGDVLDSNYLQALGSFDIVYSWGVLHHTGKMWRALENIAGSVKINGTLFIAIYNDQGFASMLWKAIKAAYNVLPGIWKYLVLYPVFLRLWGPPAVRDLITLKPFHTWNSYKARRGMSPWRDVIDWVGGYPFEVAKPDAIIGFYKAKGFNLVKMTTCGRGHGNNEFVFKKV